MKRIGFNTKAYPNTFALVDDADFDELNKYKWHIKKSGRNFYARRNASVSENKGRAVPMHRQIMQAQKGQEIDHINGNGLDNRRCNLRPCNHSQNQQNSKVQKKCKSKYKGVTWIKPTKKWRAEICKNYESYHLGQFDTEIEAARAYDKKAIELFGEFANLNFLIREVSKV